MYSKIEEWGYSISSIINSYPTIILMGLIFSIIAAEFVYESIILFVLIPGITVSILSFIIYNITTAEELDREAMFEHILENEVGHSKLKVEYKEKYVTRMSEMRYTPFQDTIYVTIGLCNRPNTRLLHDLSMIVAILHEVRHVYQLLELGYEDFNSLLFNIDKMNPYKHRVDYYGSVLEQDAYIYSYRNAFKYYKDYITGAYLD